MQDGLDMSGKVVIVTGGAKGVGAFKTSQQAYDSLHIGDPKAAAKLQAK